MIDELLKILHLDNKYTGEIVELKNGCRKLLYSDIEIKQLVKAAIPAIEMELNGSDIRPYANVVKSKDCCRYYYNLDSEWAGGRFMIYTFKLKKKSFWERLINKKK